MADSFIRLPADGAGKRLDTEELTVNLLDVHRERNQVAGATAAAIAEVINTDPGAAAYALLTRAVETEDPKTHVGSVVSVAAGSSGIIQSPQIAATKTGKLLLVLVASSIPFKADLRKVEDGVSSSEIAVAFGLVRSVILRPPAKDFWKVAGTAGGGLDAFEVEVTNLDTSRPADVYSTFLWDEVA